MPTDLVTHLSGDQEGRRRQWRRWLGSRRSRPTANIGGRSNLRSSLIATPRRFKYFRRKTRLFEEIVGGAVATAAATPCRRNRHLNNASFCGRRAAGV